MHAIKTEFGSLTHHELANLQKNSAYMLAAEALLEKLMELHMFHDLCTLCIAVCQLS